MRSSLTATALGCVEGAAGLGASLTSRLAADVVDVVDVPPSWPGGSNVVDRTQRKSDEADALSVGIGVQSTTRLNTTVIDEAIAAPGTGD